MHYIFIGITAFLLAVATMVLAAWLIIGEVGYAVVDMSQSKWPRLADKSVTTNLIIPLVKIHVLGDAEEKARFEAVPESNNVTFGINIKPNTTASGAPEPVFKPKPVLPRGWHNNLLKNE
tara:strand:- start:4315 stop:4674 length:360 start_codon:yes stop_codon:yes gene_type:complete